MASSAPPPQQNQVPDWLKRAVEAAGNLLTPKGAPPEQVPSPVSELDTVPQVTQAPDYSQLGKTVPPVSNVKNSTVAFDRRSNLEEVEVAAKAAAQDYVGQADAAVNEGRRLARKQYDDSVYKAEQDFVTQKQEIVTHAASRLQAEQQELEALAATEPDTRRWFSNMGTFGKISLIAGAVAHSLGTNPQNQSVAAQVMMRLADEDIAIQKETVTKRVAAARARKEDIQLSKVEQLAAAGDDFRLRMLKIDAIDRELQLKANSLGGDARRLAQIEGTRAELAKRRAALLDERGDQLFSRESQAAGFAHSERMARDERAFKARMQELDNEAAGLKDLRVIPPEMSNLKIITRDADGKPAVVPNRVLHKDYVEKATETAAKANEMHRLAKSLLAEVKGSDNLDLIIANNPKLNQDWQLLAGYIATDPNVNRGATTGPDYARGGAIPMGRLLEEGWAAKGVNTARRTEMAIKGLEYFLEKHGTSVNNQLQKLPTPSGDSLYWEPPKDDLKADRQARVKYMTTEEADAELANVGNAQTGREQLPRGTNLPVLTDDQVGKLQEAESAGQGATAAGKIAEVRSRVAEGADTPEAKVSADAAVKRFIKANYEDIEKARDKEYKVARKLAETFISGAKKKSVFSSAAWDLMDAKSRESLLKGYTDPTNEAVREEMVKAGFSPGKLSKEDYDNVKKQAEKLVREKLK